MNKKMNTKVTLIVDDALHEPDLVGLCFLR